MDFKVCAGNWEPFQKGHMQLLNMRFLLDDTPFGLHEIHAALRILSNFQCTWELNNELLKTELKVLAGISDVPSAKFLEYNRAHRGEMKGQFLKFRVRPDRFLQVDQRARVHQYSEVFKATLCCDWGVAMCDPLKLLEGCFNESTMQRELKGFQSSLSSQIEHFVLDLDERFRAAEGSKAAAFNNYFRQVYPALNHDWWARIEDLAAALADTYHKWSGQWVF